MNSTRPAVFTALDDSDGYVKNLMKFGVIAKDEITTQLERVEALLRSQERSRAAAFDNLQSALVYLRLHPTDTSRQVAAIESCALAIRIVAGGPE